MYAMERQSAIAKLLDVHGRVSVLELSKDFSVTTETVRRDLAQLEESGVLRRVHGGAVATGRTSTAETGIAERGVVRGAEKMRLATRALEALTPGFRGSVFIDAGSTTAALARLLPAHVRASECSVHVATHAVPVALELSADEQIETTLIGGRVRGLTAAAVGAGTVTAIEGLRPDVAFVGTNGLSTDFGVSTPDPEEAAVKQAIVRSARRVIVLADASKFEESYLVRFARLDDLDVVVSDRAPSGQLAEALREAGVDTWVP